MTDNEKSSEIAERVRRKIAEELLRRGLDPSVIFPAGKNAVGKDSRPEPKFPNSNESSVTVTSDSLSTEDKVVRARDRREERRLLGPRLTEGAKVRTPEFVRKLPHSGGCFG